MTKEKLDRANELVKQIADMNRVIANINAATIGAVTISADAGTLKAMLNGIMGTVKSAAEELEAL